MFCQLGYLPITYGIPPYGFFEHPPEIGSIPPHRTTAAHFFWRRTSGPEPNLPQGRKGLYDQDPKKVPASKRQSLKFFSRISARALLAKDLDDLIVERPILTLLQRAKCLKEFQIIDALNHPEYIWDALAGKHVGTIIHQ